MLLLENQAVCRHSADGRKGTPSRPKWTPDKRQNLGQSAIYHESSITQVKMEVVGSAFVLCIVCAVCLLCILGIACCLLLCVVSVVCCFICGTIPEKRQKWIKHSLKHDENSVDKYKQLRKHWKIAFCKVWSNHGPNKGTKNGHFLRRIVFFLHFSWDLPTALSQKPQKALV